MNIYTGSFEYTLTVNEDTPDTYYHHNVLKEIFKQTAAKYGAILEFGEAYTKYEDNLQ